MCDHLGVKSCLLLGRHHLHAMSSGCDSQIAALEAGKGRAIGVDWRDSTLGTVPQREVSVQGG